MFALRTAPVSPELVGWLRLGAIQLATRLDIQATIYYACKSIVGEGKLSPRLRAVRDLQKMRLDGGYRGILMGNREVRVFCSFCRSRRNSRPHGAEFPRIRYYQSVEHFLLFNFINRFRTTLKIGLTWKRNESRGGQSVGRRLER